METPFEAIHKVKGRGFFGFRRLLGKGDGEYLFKEIQHYPAENCFVEQWTEPIPPRGQTDPRIVYFSTRGELLAVMLRLNQGD